MYRTFMSALFFCVFLVLQNELMAQDMSALNPSDYGQFENLGLFELDPKGNWLVSGIRRVDETTELRLMASDGNSEPLVLEHATGPVFSRDGNWMAYRAGVHPDELEESDEPIHDRLGLVNLANGVDTVLFEVQRFSFRDDGIWLAAKGYAPADTLGADLMIMNPSTGAQTLIGNVDEFVWQDEGELIAATLRTSWGSSNSVVLFDPEAETLRTLDSRDAYYSALRWQDESAQLGVMRSVEFEGREGDTHDVLLWEDVNSGSDPWVLAALGRDDIPDTLRVTDYAGIDFDATGETVFVGLRDWALSETNITEVNDAESDEGSEEEEVKPADVQVWHWDDDQILRSQEYRAEQISRQTFLAAWHVRDDELVILGEDFSEEVEIVTDGNWGIVPDYTPYRFQRRFGDGAADWYRVDLQTGERTLLAREVQFGVEAGDGDSPVLVYGDDHWSAIDLTSMQKTVLAEGRSFTQPLFDHDYPGPHPPWGVGGWADTGEAVFLYDKYDIWLVELDGSSTTRITRGEEDGRIYRLVRMDSDVGFGDPYVIDSSQPVWLSFMDERTKDSGYARADLRSGRVNVLLEESAVVNSLTKAEDADRYALRIQRWDDSPDVFVGGTDLSDLRQVTRTNPFQSDYAWGHSELIKYTTDAGHELQGILVFPAEFREGEQYPLILYQYERLSDGLHRYYTPSQRRYYNYQVWSQEGYFVLMPDIVYEPGRPGPSALDAVEHALDAAVATGHVDAERIGLIGHSWGGYQASYLPTRTDRFAASVAGAAITNFLSFMGAVHWNGGLPETGHWETGQARMAVPYWDDFEGHLESSPAHGIEDLETPVLLMHGDEDGVVDFRQGLEYYNYARRAGKEVVLLVYPGADHSLIREEQQVDYHRRILDWFGHYLKGEPAAVWITEGESWVERRKRISN